MNGYVCFELFLVLIYKDASPPYSFISSLTRASLLSAPLVVDAFLSSEFTQSFFLPRQSNTDPFPPLSTPSTSSPSMLFFFFFFFFLTPHPPSPFPSKGVRVCDPQGLSVGLSLILRVPFPNDDCSLSVVTYSPLFLGAACEGRRCWVYCCDSTDLMIPPLLDRPF